MEPITQLKSLRDEALHRLQANPDYKLLTSLDSLIVDLESVANPGRPKFMIVDEDSDDTTETEPTRTDTVDEAYEKITAELEADDDAEESDDNQTFVSFN